MGDVDTLERNGGHERYWLYMLEWEELQMGDSGADNEPGEVQGPGSRGHCPTVLVSSRVRHYPRHSGQHRTILIG